MYTTTTNTLSTGNSTSSCYRPKHKGTFLHPATDHKAKHCIKTWKLTSPYISKNEELAKELAMNFIVKSFFVVKYKSEYSCASAIYFNLGTDTIKENCNFSSFRFYYNKTDITLTILDGGNEIILANGPNDKHIIIYKINNDIPVRIPSHPYILVNRSVLCNCGIEANNHYLLESLVTCENANSKLTMYFTVNTAFINYLDMFPNLTESLEFPIITNRTTHEQTLPISLNIFRFDKTLLTVLTNLKDFFNSYTKHEEIFDLQERHENMILNTNKNFFSDHYLMEIYLFISAIISLLTTTLTIYLLCKHKKIRTLIASFGFTSSQRSKYRNTTNQF